ncbi:MAG: PA2779 family protein [Mariprofundus sp.]|nr:PA2779 family protein [Mariprofundus sp.]
MKTFFKKSAISLLALFIGLINVQMPVAQAAIVTTDQVIAMQDTNADRERVIAFLDRADVQQELVKQGVSPDEAKARVAHLNDEELAMLSGNIDELPAGGFVGALIGAGLFVFVVLLITDLLGFTDVFPFAHSHAH